jgi:hypothetical protein
MAVAAMGMAGRAAASISTPFVVHFAAEQNKAGRLKEGGVISRVLVWMLHFLKRSLFFKPFIFMSGAR